MMENNQTPMNGLAIASLVLAIIGFLSCPGIVLFGPISLILGIIALSQIKGSAQNPRGYGLAVAGIVISAVGLFFVPFMAAILFPVFSKARQKAQQASCMSNIKQINLSMLMYSQDHDGKLPALNKWNDFADSPRTLICPSADSRELPSYAMNAKVDGISLNSIKTPDEFVLIFDSEPGRNRFGGPELLPLKPRHSGGDNFGFADGHAKFVPNLSGRYTKWEDIPRSTEIRPGSNPNQ